MLSPRRGASGFWDRQTGGLTPTKFARTAGGSLVSILLKDSQQYTLQMFNEKSFLLSIVLLMQLALASKCLQLKEKSTLEDWHSHREMSNPPCMNCVIPMHFCYVFKTVPCSYSSQTKLFRQEYSKQAPIAESHLLSSFIKQCKERKQSPRCTGPSLLAFAT